ncbi:MAG: hypothetical protein J6P02_01940 [Lachnospiraceae bacterium]|nr:hypothetical protein [Lachnospiraceae bacterium]
MKKVNDVKNIAIVLDFVVSIIASAIQKSNQSVSGMLFGLSAVILLVAVVCVVIELVKKK